MPRVCSVCSHPNRDDIETALRNGNETQLSVSKRYGISSPAITRHRAHMIDAVALEADKVELPAIVPEVRHEEVSQADDGTKPPSAGLTAYQSTLGLKEKAERALEMAEKENDMAKMAFWFKELRSTLELIFKVGIAQRALEGKSHKDISPELQAKIDTIVGGGA